MDKTEIRHFIARRAAKELKDGDVVNLDFPRWCRCFCLRASM